MSKFDRYNDYPNRGLAKAQAALLTVWPTLNRYHDDLVLVGGLAIHCLTRPIAGGYPVAVTIDADLGLSLGAGGGMYGTISTDLAGLGFRQDAEQPSRYVREIEGTKVYLDFLTEAPSITTGTRTVDDVVASVIPGIDRALESAREVEISGQDLYGAKQTVPVRVADIGPLLTLKINAFGGPHGRRHPKDAYDVLLSVTAYVDGYETAVQAFLAESEENNPAYATAVEALRRDFSKIDADGPIRASEFLRGTFDEDERIRQDVVTVAKALLGNNPLLLKSSIARSDQTWLRAEIHKTQLTCRALDNLERKTVVGIHLEFIRQDVLERFALEVVPLRGTVSLAVVRSLLSAKLGSAH